MSNEINSFPEWLTHQIAKTFLLKENASGKEKEELTIKLDTFIFVQKTFEDYLKTKITF